MGFQPEDTAQKEIADKTEQAEKEVADKTEQAEKEVADKTAEDERKDPEQTSKMSVQLKKDDVTIGKDGKEIKVETTTTGIY